MLDGFVGTVDGGIKLRVVQVDPIGFFGAGLDDGVRGEGESIWKS